MLLKTALVALLAIAGCSEMVGKSIQANSFGTAVTTDHSTYAHGDTVTVAYANMDTSGSLNWVSIAADGSSDSSYISFAYVTNGISSGTYATSTLTGGNYVARAYFNNSYTKEAESTSFFVGSDPDGPHVTTSATFAPSQPIPIAFEHFTLDSTDWISISPSGSADTVFDEFSYTAGTASGTVTLSGYLPPGSYIARGYFADSYVRQAEAAFFVVSAVSTDMSVHPDGSAGPTNALRIMPLGDSITAGAAVTGLSWVGGYRVPLWNLFQADSKEVDYLGIERNGATYIPDQQHEGHPGYLIEDIQSSLATYLGEDRPYGSSSVVLLMVGTNNVLRYAGDITAALTHHAALLDSIISFCNGCYIVDATIPGFYPASSLDAVVDTYNAGVREIVAAKASSHVNLADIHAAVNVATDLQGDGVHPNDDGYTAIAGAWYAALSVLQ